MNQTRLSHLMSVLSKLGFQELHRESNQAVLRRGEDGATFVLVEAADWIQAAQTVLDGDEIQRTASERVAVLAMRLHARFLGCRFAFDDDGSLMCLCDIYPGASDEQVRLALEQLSYVASSALPLFEEVAAADAVITDERIDLALCSDPGAA